MTPSTGKYLVLSAEDSSITIIPQLGGKIASIRVRGQELLQCLLAPYGARDRAIPFHAGDAGGWDECMPSVAQCMLQTGAGTITIPDHGDLWRVAWQLLASSTCAVTLRAECFSLPLALERTLTLSKVASGWRLKADYNLSNTGSHPAPWLWAAHPLFAVEAGDRILLPDSIRTLRVEGSRGNRLGKRDAVIAWPVAVDADSSHTDLSLVQPPQSGIADKLFAGPLGPSENWCAIERLSIGMRIRLRFDPASNPYLGLWICCGGWPERPGPKQMCVALEPATAPVDSLAQAGSCSRLLAPGDRCEWSMVAEFEAME